MSVFANLRSGSVAIRNGEKTPVAIVQLYCAVDVGYWYARSLQYSGMGPLRGDALFTLGGGFATGLPLLVRLRYPNPRRIKAESELPRIFILRVRAPNIELHDAPPSLENAPLVLKATEHRFLGFR